MARLLLLHDGLPVRSYTLREPGVTIGRGPDSDIALDDSAVSASHAVIRVETDPYLEGRQVATLEDLNSTNGTLVNGQAVQCRVLRQGDRVRIGRQELSYETDDEGVLERTTIYLPDEPR